MQSQNSMKNLNASLELKSEVQSKHQRTANGFYSQKLTTSTKAPQPQENLEMHLLPSTNKHYKRTFRHHFKRRMNLMERPLIVVMFQGVLGDFMKDSGISAK
jgi:hypothetical protein